MRPWDEDVAVQEAADWVVLKHNPMEDGFPRCGFCAGNWPCYYRTLADFALAQIDRSQGAT